MGQQIDRYPGILLGGERSDVPLRVTDDEMDY
jgi:hypothetical protein